MRRVAARARSRGEEADGTGFPFVTTFPRSSLALGLGQLTNAGAPSLSGSPGRSGSLTSFWGSSSTQSGGGRGRPCLCVPMTAAAARPSSCHVESERLASLPEEEARRPRSASGEHDTPVSRLGLTARDESSTFWQYSFGSARD